MGEAVLIPKHDDKGCTDMILQGDSVWVEKDGVIVYICKQYGGGTLVEVFSDESAVERGEAVFSSLFPD